MIARRLALIFAAFGLAAPAAATELEDRLREQLRATVTQLRELQSSQSSLEAAKAAAEKERDALKAKGSGESPAAKAAAAREITVTRQAAAAASAKAATAAADAAKAAARATDLQARLAVSDAELARLRASTAASGAALGANAAALTACTARNARLVDAGRALVALHVKRYGHGKFPPLQLLRTRVENEAQAIGDTVTANVEPQRETPR